MRLKRTDAALADNVKTQAGLINYGHPSPDFAGQTASRRIN
jgi:hypothetical protein